MWSTNDLIWRTVQEVATGKRIPVAGISSRYWRTMLESGYFSSSDDGEVRLTEKGHELADEVIAASVGMG